MKEGLTMNEKWSEKTKLQKVMDIIAWIALCVWIVFEALEKMNKVQHADLVNCIALGVVCVCEAISLWNVKRALSYVAIAGAVCLITVIVLLTI